MKPGIRRLSIVTAALALPVFLAASVAAAVPATAVFTEDDGNGAVRHAYLLKLTGDPAEANAGGPAGVWTAVAHTRDIEAGGPWLGVQFAPVPKALASHLGIEPDSGQMILNVINDSPADAAGLEQYDVIVRIDDEPVSAEIGEFLGVVRGFAPNETHRFSLIRGGRPTEAQVTVGTRPESLESAEYKYEVDKEEESQGQLFQRGGVMQKDKSGNWVFKRFRDLKGLPDIWRFMPDIDDEGALHFSWQGAFPGIHNRMSFLDEKGRSLRIERDEDGRITVTKTERHGKNETTTTRTYADEAEFKEKDPETYKQYKGTFQFGLKGSFRTPGFFFSPKKGMHGRLFFGPDEDFDFDFNLDEIQKEIDKAFESQSDLRKHLESLKDELGTGLEADDEIFIGKPTTHFEVDADGTIRVTTRKAGQQLVETFENAAHLKRARPELYKNYEKLKASQGE